MDVQKKNLTDSSFILKYSKQLKKAASKVVNKHSVQRTYNL